MPSVDTKVVEMRFNNEQFEKATRVTMQTLEKLKAALKLDNATDSLNAVNDALKETSSGANMETLANNVQTISNRFTDLGVIATSALTRITNKAVDTGLALAKSIVLDPIMDGFREYELEMTSIQTIMASTGKSAEEVQGYLDELNSYADATIYSFSDMTASIGKFTNAGVDLDRAVGAIQGISNEAARSGANANEASRAMYNFAQAIATGSVKLIDWKSIENANMATVEFKQQLIDTAVELGTVEEAADGYYNVLTQNAQGSTMKDTISATKSFNDSLAYQWLTADVLIETLNKYSDATTDIGAASFAAAKDVKTYSQMIDTLKESVGSSWAGIFRALFGNINEAKILWTSIANIIDPIFTMPSNILANMAKTIFPAFRQAIYELFPDASAGIQAFGDAINKITSAFMGSEKVVNSLKEIFKALLTPIGAVLRLVGALGMAFLNIAGTALHVLGDALSFVVNIIGKVAWAFNSVISAIVGFANSIMSFFKPAADKASESVEETSENVEDMAKTVRETVDPIQNATNSIKGFFEGLASGVKSALSKVVDPIKKFASDAKEAISVIYNTKVIGFVISFTNSLNALKNSFESGWNGTYNEVTNGFDEVAEKARSLKNSFDEVGIAIRNFINNLAKRFQPVLEASSKVAEKFKSSFGKIGDAVKGFVGSKIDDMLKGIGNFVKMLSNIDYSSFDSFVSYIVGIADAIANFNADDINIGDYFKSVLDSIASFDPAKAASSFQSGMANIIDVVSQFMTSIDWGKIGQSVLSGINTVMSTITTAFNKIVQFVANLDWQTMFNAITTGIQTGIGAILLVITTIASNIKGGMIQAFNALKSVIDGGAKETASEFDEFGNRIGSIPETIENKAQSVFEAVKSLAFKIRDAIGFVIGEIFSNIGFIGEVIGNVVDGIKNILSKVSGYFKEFTSNFKMADVVQIVNTLLLAFNALNTFNIAKGFKNLTETTGPLSKIIDIIKGIGEFKDNLFKPITDGLEELSSKVQPPKLLLIAGSMLAIAAAVYLLGTMNPEKAAVGIGLVTGMLLMLSTVLIGLMMLAQEMDPRQITSLTSLAPVLAAIGTSLLLLAIALRVAAGADPLKMAIAIVELGFALAGLIGSCVALSKWAPAIGKVAAPLLALSIAISLLVPALVLLGSVPYEVVSQGLGAIGSAMMVMVGAMSLMSAFVGGGTLTAFGREIKLFGSSAPELLTLGAAFLMLAASMAIITVAIAALGAMPFDTLKQGLGSLAAVMIGLGVALAALSAISAEVWTVSISLLTLSAAIAGLAVAFSLMAMVPFESVIYSLGMLAVTMITFAGLASAMGAISAPIAAFGAALGLIAVGALTFATAILVASAALVVLTGVGAGAAATLQMMIVSLASTIPLLFMELATGINSFFEILISGLATQLPTLIQTLLDSVRQNIGGFIDIIAETLAKVKEKAHEFGQTGADIAIEFVSGVLDGLREHFPEFFEAGDALFGETVSGLFEQIGTAVGAAIEFAAGILGAIFGFLGEFFSVGSQIISSITGGIQSLIENPIGTVRDMASRAVNALRSGLSGFFDAGSNAVQGFINGLLSGISGIASAAATLARNAWDSLTRTLDEHSPSKLTKKAGVWFDQGLINGIVKLIPAVGKAASTVGEKALLSMQSSIEGISNISDGMEYTPSITPVIDFTNAKAINESFDDLKAIQTLNLKSDIDSSYLGSEAVNIVDSIESLQNATEIGNDKIWGAINEIRNEIISIQLNGSGGNTYTIQNIDFSGDPDIEGAMMTIFNRMQRLGAM